MYCIALNKYKIIQKWKITWMTLCCSVVYDKWNDWLYAPAWNQQQSRRKTRVTFSHSLIMSVWCLSIRQSRWMMHWMTNLLPLQRWLSAMCYIADEFFISYCQPHRVLCSDGLTSIKIARSAMPTRNRKWLRTADELSATTAVNMAVTKHWCQLWERHQQKHATTSERY